jgi:hypothetical protein
MQFFLSSVTHAFISSSSSLLLFNEIQYKKILLAEGEAPRKERKDE